LLDDSVKMMLISTFILSDDSVKIMLISTFILSECHSRHCIHVNCGMTEMTCRYIRQKKKIKKATIIQTIYKSLRKQKYTLYQMIR
jgi:hypothetical protein